MFMTLGRQRASLNRTGEALIKNEKTDVFDFFKTKNTC